MQTRRSGNGTALLGGVPFRVLRLSEAGARRVDAWLSSTPVDGAAPTEAETALRRQLLESGLAHPLATAATDLGALGVVVPVLDDVDGLAELLPRLRSALPDNPIVVVDDGSTDPAGIAEVGDAHGVDVVRHEHNRGPAAARNTGWQHLRDRAVELVAFVDADITVDRAALQVLVGHFASPAVGVVAPRVLAQLGASARHRYDAVSSPLDLGPDPALVRPHTRVSYVPSAVLVFRDEVLADVVGFAEDMRVGEDVDIVWRTVRAGWHVRYDPAAQARHRTRPTLRAMAAQRHGYGTSAALLEARHPRHVFPVEVSLTQAALWLAAAVGRWPGRLAALAGFGASVVEFERNLSSLGPDARPLATEILVEAHGAGLRWLADATGRAWAPMLLLSRRGRRLLTLGLVVPALLDWWKSRTLDPARFVALRVVDHGAYCAGLWVGAWRARSARVLLPRFRRR